MPTTKPLRDANDVALNTLWLARDGRLMRFKHWIPGRSKPTALMEVVNPTYRMRKYSEQGLSSFGSFLQLESEQTINAEDKP